MTTAQEDAIKRIDDILQEHFIAAVLVVEAERDDKTVYHQTTFHGGHASALGLLEIGNRAIHQGRKRSDENEEAE